MSEQIEIEVGVSTARFNQAIQGIQRSLAQLGNATAGIRVDALNTGLESVRKTTEKNKREALTLRTAFQEIGNIRVSNKSLNDIKEITKEFLRIVKELGPVITLAMNALDRPLQKAVLSMVKMLTEVERANSNFLVLRKVLPIRLFNSLGVNAQRVATSVKGMTKDFRDFGDRGSKAISKTGEVLRKLVEKISEARERSNGLSDSLSQGGFSKAQQAMASLSDRTRQVTQSMSEFVSRTKAGEAILNGLSASANKMKSSFVGISSSTKQATSSLARFTRGFGNATKSSKALGMSFAVLAQVASGGVAVAFKTLQFSIGILSQGMAKLISSGVPKFFQATKASAQIATNAVKGFSSAITKIAVAPLKAVGSTFSGLTSILSGARSIFATVAISVASLTALLVRSANGAVAEYRKNWIKTLSELPNASKSTERALKKDLKSLQGELGILGKDALPALRRAFQIGFDESGGIDAVRQAVSLFLNDVSDLEGSVTILGNSMRAFAGTSLTAEEAVDKLFTASKAGGVNLDELGSAVQRIGPVISEAGVSFDQFTSAMAVLVRSGRTTYQAMNDLASVATAVANPTREAETNFNRLGIEFGANAISAKGFSTILQEIVTKTQGSTSGIRNLLGSQENLNTALNLGGENASFFSDTLDRVNNSSGNAKASADELDNAFARSLRKVRVLVEGLMQDLGTIMQPAITSLNEFVQEYTQKIREVANIGVQIFKNGDLGKLLELAFQVGTDRGLVLFKNFTAKASAGLLAGLGEALAQFGNLTPFLLQVFSDLWNSVKSGFASFIGGAIQGIAVLGNVIATALIKGIELAWEKFQSLFGGDFKSRDASVIFQQQLEESDVLKIGQQWSSVATKIDQESKTTGKQIVDQLLPAVTAVGNAITTAVDGVGDVAQVSQSTIDAQKELQELVDKASKQVEDGSKQVGEVAKDVADASNLVKGARKEGEQSSRASDLSTIASSLARVGGGGNVEVRTQTTIAQEQLNTQKEQLKIEKLMLESLGALSLGEVR